MCAFMVIAGQLNPRYLTAKYGSYSGVMPRLVQIRAAIKIPEIGLNYAEQVRRS